MATILTVTTNPESFLPGAWPASAFNSGVWRVTFTPSSASGPAYSAFGGLFGQATGGIWIANSALELYTSPGDALVFSRAMTWSAGQALTFTINVPALTLTIAGATTGNGTFSFSGAPSGPYFNASDGLRAGGAYGVSGFALAGTISNVDDTNTGTTYSRSAAITGTGAIVVASGVRTMRRSSALTGTPSITIGSSALVLQRSSALTATASITVATGQRVINRSSALTGTSTIVVTSAVGGFGLGAYGAARVLYGSPAGNVSVTLNTASAGSTILIAVGGNLGDLATLPTDNRGNTWSTVGTDEYSRWTGYGIKLYQCVGATGGSSHTFTQQYGQTAGFDECTITVVEIKAAAWVQASSLVERALGSSVATGAVTSVTDCEWIVFLSGDAPTGATTALTPSNGLTILDDSTGIDHPNGYVPIVILRAAKPAGTHASTVGISPSQGAIIGAFAVQALRVIARSSSVTGVSTVTVATGVRQRVRGSSVTGASSITVARGERVTKRASALTGASAITVGAGIVLPPGGSLVERAAALTGTSTIDVARGQRTQFRGTSLSAASSIAVARGGVTMARSSSVTALSTIHLGQSAPRPTRVSYTSTGVVTMAASLIVGDLEPDLILQCLEPSGVAGGVQAIDLTGAAGVSLRIRRPDSTVVTRTAAIEDATRGLVRYVWVPNDTAQTGQHRGQIVITWANGENQTVPSDGSTFIWTINPSL